MPWLSRVRLALGIAFVVTYGACSRPYEPISQGRAYDDALSACSFNDQMRAARTAQPPHDDSACAALDERLRNLKPYRRYLWLEDPGPPVHDVVLEYLCLTPHWSQLTMWGALLTPLLTHENRAGKGVLGIAPPPEVAELARRELYRVVPRAKEVVVHLTRSRRVLRVEELMKLGAFGYAHVEASWNASADLSEIIQRPGAWIDRRSQVRLRSCRGRWLEFESLHHTEPAPVVTHALERIPDQNLRIEHRWAAPELAEELERALLVAARHEPNFAPDSAIQSLDALEANMGESLLPEGEQHLQLHILWRSDDSSWIEAQRVTFAVPTRALVFDRFEASSRVLISDHPFILRVLLRSLDPVSPDVIDPGIQVPTALDVQIETSERVVFSGSYLSKLDATVERGASMAAGSTAWTSSADLPDHGTKFHVPGIGGQVLRIEPLNPSRGSIAQAQP